MCKAAMDPLTNQVFVSRMRPEHLARVMELQTECHAQSVHESAASIRAKILASPDTCFVACSGPSMIGYLIAFPFLFAEIPALSAPECPIPPRPDVLYIHDVAMAAPGRGTGAARMLVEALLSQARKQDFDRVSLTALEGMSPFWSRMGFTVLAPIPETLSEKLRQYGPASAYMFLAMTA